MRERKPPTHVLVVELPLNMDGEHDFDPLQDALKIVLSVSRLAVNDVLCGDPQVTLRDDAAG